MMTYENRTRVFVYRHDLTAADSLALLLWDAGYEGWPFSEVDAMAGALRKVSPQLAFLEVADRPLPDVVQLSVQVARLCPGCRFSVFASQDGAELGQPPFYEGQNLEIFRCAPAAEEVLRLAARGRASNASQ